MLLTATAEAMGGEIKPVTAALLASDLEPYPLEDIERALCACRGRGHSRLTLSDIKECLHEGDGRPGADEAWALIPKDEAGSVVWCDEMARAWGVVSALYADGDKVGARVAFRGAYERMVADARRDSVAVHWWASLGSDCAGREDALRQAVEAKRLTADVVKPLLPAPRDAGPVGDALFGGAPLRLEDLAPEDRDRARRHIGNLRAILAGRAAT